jgi:methionyl-tRNA formyltransferase
MSDSRSVLILAEPETHVSDGLVPTAVGLLEERDGLELDGVVDVSAGGGDPDNYGGRLEVAGHYLSRLSDPRVFAWRLYRRLRGFRNPIYPPYPAVLDWMGVDASTHLVPPENDVNHPDFVDRVERMDPDVILLLGCSQILEAELIDVPSMGAVNFHWSYLPEYRGRNVTFWAAYNREPHSGVTFHQIDSDVDQGTRVLAEGVRVRKGARTLVCDCIDRGRELLEPLLDAVASGRLPQNGPLRGGEYYSLERYEDADTAFDPERGFEHNSRVMAAREGSIERFEGGPTVVVTGLRFAGWSASGEYGEVLGVDRRGVKLNLCGEAHYLSGLFHLPAYPVATLLGIRAGMRLDRSGGPDAFEGGSAGPIHHPC